MLGTVRKEPEQIDWAEALRGVGAPLWTALAVVLILSAVYWSVSVSPFVLVSMVTIAVAAALVFVLSGQERGRRK